ncbi:unnamed protein product [Trichobilharzia szidati]|nr:unnamed protein product [Trichobilharzia szidati]
MSINSYPSPVVKSIHDNNPLNDSSDSLNKPTETVTVTPTPTATTTVITSPFGFPIFPPICDASGDVDYRILLNPALRNLTNNDTMNTDYRSQEINQALKSSSSSLSVDRNSSGILNPDTPVHNINDTDLSSDSNNNNNKSLHKTQLFSVKQLNPNNVVSDTTSDRKPTENEPPCKDGRHNEDEEEEDNMEVSDGEEPEVDAAAEDDDTKKNKRKVNVDNTMLLITSDTQDKDWRIFTQQLPLEVKPLSHLSSSPAPSGNMPSPCIRPPIPPPPPPPLLVKNPIGWPLPPEPILQPIIPIQSNPLPTPAPIRIPPPPPPPQFVGVLGGQRAISPPPPLPSTLNELTGYHHIPTALGGVGGGGVVVTKPDIPLLVAPPPPLPPPPPPPLLHPPPPAQSSISPSLYMDKINMISNNNSNNNNNNNNLVTKSIEPNVLITPTVTISAAAAAAVAPTTPPSTAVSSAMMIQSQNYSAFDLLKNLCQSNVVTQTSLSKPSSSSLSLPTFPLSSSTTPASSISKESTPQKDYSSVPSQQMTTNSTVSDASKVSHTLALETNSDPLVDSNDISNNNNKNSTEDPFAIISRLTGLSNLIKNIPIQSSLSTIPLTSPTLINSTESFHSNPSVKVNMINPITTTTTTTNNNNNTEMSNYRLQSVPPPPPTTTTTTIRTEGFMNTSSTAMNTTMVTTTYSSTACTAAKRSRFSDIPSMESGIIDQQTIPLTVYTTEQSVLSSNSGVPSSSASSSSTSSGKLSISNSFNNSSDLNQDLYEERRDHSMTSYKNYNNNGDCDNDGDEDYSADCGGGSGGGDTPTQDEREDDHHHPLSDIPQNRSLLSIHPFNTSPSSLADLLIPNNNNNDNMNNNSCHGVDPNSFLSKNPMHSISQSSSCILSSSTSSSSSSASQGYGVSFNNNNSNLNTSTTPVSSIGLSLTQFSSMIPPNAMSSIMTGNNTTNLSVTSCSQVPPGGGAAAGGGLMFYQSPRISLPPRGLPPGGFMISPQHHHHHQQQQQQTRPAMSSLLPGNIQQIPSTPSDWSKSVIINNQLRQQRLQPPQLVQQHPPNDFWSMMSTVPPPPPPPPPHPSAPLPPHSLSSSTRPPQGALPLRQSAFPTFNASQIRSQTPSSIGVFNPFAINKPM